MTVINVWSKVHREWSIAYFTAAVVLKKEVRNRLLSKLFGVPIVKREVDQRMLDSHLFLQKLYVLSHQQIVSYFVKMVLQGNVLRPFVPVG
jgi:hypothetical protein